MLFAELIARRAASGKVRRLLWLAGMGLILSVPPTAASARTFQVKVDARSAPWDRRSNPRLTFGGSDGRMPTLVWGARLFPGTKVTFRASGNALWIAGGQRYGPDGDPSRIVERSVTLIPYHFVEKSKPIGMIGLVGAFVNADGKVVGKPFSIGESARIVVPDGAIAISLGVNDDYFHDNDGFFQVSIDVPEPNVIVETDDSNE